MGADACIIPYAEPGGEVDRISEQMKQWHVPFKPVMERWDHEKQSP
jgi:hypothetical protein